MGSIYFQRPILWCIVLSVLALRGTKGCQGGCHQDNCCGGCRSSCTTQVCVQSCCSSCCCESPSPRPTAPPTPWPQPAPQPPPHPRPPPYSNNNVNNDINSTLDVTINNHINVENRVYVPISINNSNIQSVSIVDEDNNTNSNIIPTYQVIFQPPPIPPIPPTAPTPPTRPTPPTPPNPTPTVPPWNVTTHITPTSHPSYIIIRIPVPYYIYKTYPVPIPYPGSNGCCTVIRPCVGQGCQSHRQHCGSGCLGSVMYEPINPCHAGCLRRSWGHRQICSEGSCVQTPVDCNGCNSDFFQTYGGFQRCGGCFSGMPLDGSGAFAGGGLGGYESMGLGGDWRR
nr:unnamed protein product [Callosobruchus chinensis]